MTGHLAQELWLPAPILHHLRRGLDKVALDTSTREASKRTCRHHAVEAVTEFMSKGLDVRVRQQAGTGGVGWGEVADHGNSWLLKGAVGLQVAALEWEDGSVSELALARIEVWGSR